MKLFYLFAAVCLCTTACNNSDTDTDATTTSDQQQAAVTDTSGAFKVDTSRSVVQWTGYKPGGQHTGTFRISSGSINADTSTITAGHFEINIAALKNEDLSGDDKAKLEGHLKSADFFETSKYPTARFDITKVSPVNANGTDTATLKMKDATHIISGNLRLKDQTKNVSFPAKVRISGNELSADGTFDIDRTEWQMNYKGPNNPQNWFIKKEVTIRVNIIANR